MNSYAIGHITIKDPLKWAEYRRRLPDTLLPWGAEIVMRGTQAVVLSGQHHRTDTVVICFPGADSADNWYRSPAYQALIPLRDQAADVDLVRFRAD